MTRPLLVTGGTGFLGKALVGRLVADGERVRVLGRRPVPRWRGESHIEHVRGDIADPGVVAEVLRDVDRVYHLAAATQGSWAAFEGTTVNGLRHVLQALAHRGGGRLVLVSSLGNYDGGTMRHGDVIDEQFPLERNAGGRGRYARAKIEAEDVAGTFLDTVGVTIVRPGIVYGPGVNNPLAGAALSIRGRLWVTLGRGDKRLPLVYIDDVIEALVRIMATPATIGRVYNVVHDEQPTQNEYLRLHRAMTGARTPLVRFPLAALIPVLRAGEALTGALRRRQLVYKASRILKRVTYVGDALERDIGFAPPTDLRRGLAQMWGRHTG